MGDRIWRGLSLKDRIAAAEARRVSSLLARRTFVIDITGPASHPPDHNGGPPLEPGRSWRRFCWRKARKAAFALPPPEVWRRRLKQAQALGLTYEQLTARILDGERLTDQ
ncbi:MAG: hypothetical protein RLO50_11660 [Azospirillaceae bacterium]